MGQAASELECKVCSCSCEDGLLRYGDAHGGGKPPEYPWQEEVCQLEENAADFRNRKDVMYESPADRTYAARSSEDSPASSPNTFSPAVYDNRRQSWQDLDADGNYHLHFNLPPGDRLGLQLVEMRGPQPSGVLAVSSVESTGPFAYTSRQSPGLFSGDIILKVNRKRGGAAGLRDVLNQAVSAGGEVALLVQARPAAFDVLIKRSGPNWKKLGLSVAIDRADQIPRMRVRTVRNEGLVPKWNEMNGTLRICQGDWITQVNGVGKSADVMFKMIQANTEGEELELRIETPSRDVPRQELEQIASPMATPMATPRIGNGETTPMASPRIGNGETPTLSPGGWLR